MSPAQKQAWFNLAVISATMVAIGALIPFLGVRAQGGFGVLGLLAFGMFFFRRRAGEVVADERDRMIQQRSGIIAYAVFWVAFVLETTIIVLRYGDRGCVPVIFVSSSVWSGFMVLYAVSSIATLVQYGRK